MIIEPVDKRYIWLLPWVLDTLDQDSDGWPWAPLEPVQRQPGLAGHNLRKIYHQQELLSRN